MPPFTELPEKVGMEPVTSPKAASEAGSDSCRRYGWRGHSLVSHEQASLSTTRSLNQVGEGEFCASECREGERESLMKLADDSLLLPSTINFERTKDQSFTTASRSYVHLKHRRSWSVRRRQCARTVDF